MQPGAQGRALLARGCSPPLLLGQQQDSRAYVRVAAWGRVLLLGHSHAGVQSMEVLRCTVSTSSRAIGSQRLVAEHLCGAIRSGEGVVKGRAPVGLGLTARLAGTTIGVP